MTKRIFKLRFVNGGYVEKSYRFDLDKGPKSISHIMLAASGHPDVAAYARKLSDNKLYDQVIDAAGALYPLPWNRHSRDCFHNYIVEYYRRGKRICQAVPGEPVEHDTLVMGD